MEWRVMVTHDTPTAMLGFCLLPLPSGEVGMLLGMTGEGIAPITPMPSPESRAKRLSTSPEGRGKKSAFSLVELSIVLVILGLLTGGILAGQSLIRASELRSVVSQYQRYVAAVNTFKDKYFALPGDMPNATQFWQKQGGLGGYAATCNSNSGAGFNAATQQGGCDGNGDGVVLNNRTTLTTDESAQYWQHLKMSGLIQFKYANSSGDGGIGINYNSLMSSPLSRYPNGLWSIFRNDVDWA